MNPPNTVGGNVNRYHHHGKQVWRFLKKLKIKPPYDPVIPLLGIYPEKTKKKSNSKRYMYPNVHSTTIYNSLGREAT